jgi:hypothetical protein
MQSFPRVLVDEAHCEAWSIDPTTAGRMNPVNPADASYALAAETLRRRGCAVAVQAEGTFTAEALARHDVLVVAHPADPRLERTTGVGSPVLSDAELDVVESYVRRGGGLVVMAECDQDVSGNNLNELLARFGVRVVSTTVQEATRRHKDVATWVLGDLADPRDVGVLAGVGEACF